MLVQAGGTMGDKSFSGCLSNMKHGEYRYYPQDNHNIRQDNMREISKKVFQRILKHSFPEYVVDPDPDDGEFVGSVGKNELLPSGDFMYDPHVINKGYIWFKECTLQQEGTLVYLHDGSVLVYKEKYSAPLKQINNSSVSPKQLSENFEKIILEDLDERPYKIEDENQNQAILINPCLFQKLIDCALNKDNKDFILYNKVCSLDV